MYGLHGLHGRGKALIGACLFGLASIGLAGVIPTAAGYEVSYGINMTPGSSNGSDISNVVLFEWDNSHFSALSVGSIAGQGNTFITHDIGFAPTSALMIGYGLGIAGIGDEKDHLYTLTSSAFASTVGGLKWSQAFPGVTPDTRVRHERMISLLIDGNLGAISDFVRTEGYVAAFDPAGSFVVLEWSTCPPGFQGVLPNCVPVGHSIPEPTSLALIGLGLAGIAYRRSKRKAAA